MYCPMCGKVIPDESVFCMHCGRAIPAIPQDPPGQAFHQKSDTVELPLPGQAAVHSHPFEEPACTPELPDDTTFNGFEQLDAMFNEPEAFEEALPIDPFDEADPFEEPDLFAEDLNAFDPLPLPNEARCCTICGRELPQSSISDICITCLNNRSIVPDKAGDSKPFTLNLDLDDEYPEEYRDLNTTIPHAKKPVLKKRFSLRLLMLPPILLALALGGWYLVSSLSSQKPQAPVSPGSSSAASVLPDLEKSAVYFAQDMVKAKAANPDSVHFDKSSLKVNQDGEEWTVSQTFDRLTPSGETANSSYTALFSQNKNAEEGFQPLMLQVDGKVLYDNRTG